jgi:N-acyl homoserine lactone hydrolase
MTHLHTDHAGGLHDFPSSEILVNGAEYRPARGFGGKAASYLPQRWPGWFEPKPMEWEPVAFGPFKSSARVTEAGAVVVVPTPGHTPAHVSVVVVDGERSFFLAGDASYTQRLLVEQQVDGISPDEATARQTMQKVLRYAQETPTVYLPTHDPDSGRRLEDRATLQSTG